MLGRRGEDLAAGSWSSRVWWCCPATGDVGTASWISSPPTRDELVVCEVKTRSGTRFGEPAEAVTGRKAHRIRRVTQAWLAAHQVRWCEIRFDVLAVVAEPGRPVTVQHYEAAF